MMRSLSISVRVGDGREGGGDGDVSRLKGCRRYHDHSGSSASITKPMSV
jgi:hypothetical protein